MNDKSNEGPEVNAANAPALKGTSKALAIPFNKTLFGVHPDVEYERSNQL